MVTCECCAEGPATFKCVCGMNVCDRDKMECSVCNDNGCFSCTDGCDNCKLEHHLNCGYIVKCGGDGCQKEICNGCADHGRGYCDECNPNN